MAQMQGMKIALENAQMLIWELDFTNGELRYEAEHLRFLGIMTDTPPQNVEGWIALIHPDDRAAFIDNFQLALQAESPGFDLEYRYAQQPEQWGWAHTKGQVIKRDAAGNPLLAVGSTLNITIRKQADLEFREAQQRFEMIFNSNPDVMVISRLPEGIITNVNDAFVLNTGYSKEEAIGKTTVELACWSDEDRHMMTDAIKNHGYCSELEFDFLMKGGQKKTGSFSAVATSLQGVPHLVSTIHDITARKEMEVALQQSESLLRSTLDSTDEGILMIGHDGRVLSANQRFMELWRIPKTLAEREQDELLLDHVLEQLIDPEAFLNQIRRLYDSDEQARDTLHFKDGRVFSRFTRALMIGEERGRIWCFKDVTQQTHAQTALAEREEIFRSIVTQAYDGIVMIDVNTMNFVEFNAAAYANLGYSREEFSSLSVADIQSAMSAEGVKEKFSLILTHGAAEFETLHRHKDGSQRTVRISSKAIRIHGQDFIGAIITDISERKQIETELLKTKERYDIATSVGHIGTWDWTPVTGALLWSDETFRLLGYEPGSMIPTYELFLSLVHPDDRVMVNNAALAALHEDQPYTLDCRIVRSDGNQLVCHVTGKVEFNAQHQPVRMLGTIQDVSERYQAAETLRATEQKLRVILDNVDAYIYLKDADGNYLFANKPVRELWQSEMADIIGYGDDKFFDAKTAAHIRSNDQRVLQGGETLRAEETNTVPETGITHTFLYTKLPLRHEDGSIYALCGISTDITTRKKIELELAEREAQLRTLIEAVPDAIQFKDGEGRWLIANNICLSNFGLEGKEWQNLTDTEIGLRYPHLAEAMEACIARDNEAWAAGQIFRVEDSSTGPNGVMSHYDVHKIPLFDEEHKRKALVIVARDVTDKKQSEELIWHQANFDFLTQLPNRRMFRDRLSQDLKKAHRGGLKLALLFLDLDHFKEVNDTLGHDMGDILLIEAAQRITACVRESDTVARLGGDEFTIILAELDDLGAIERIADNIIHALRLPFQLGDNTVYVSASIGITLYPDDCTELEDLLKNADQSMFASKQAGRNRYSYFTSGMQQAAQHRIRIINDMHIALSEDQFQLHYQPIIELSTGQVRKAEALLRWFHPEHGLISPAEFIPLAEESGIIHELGDWVFAEAAKQLSHCHNNCDTDFQLSVNVSPVQFHGINKQSKWLENLKDMGVTGDSIVIEITEGLLLDYTANVTGQLLAFRDAGIQVAIDDFGTGYSALSYLKKLDIDYLKIDQSFIRNLTTDSSDMALVEAIVVMAHKLGLKVIAEGVETAEQNQRLTDIGCDFVQGYFHSRPLPAEHLEPWLKQRRKAAK